MSSIHIYGRFEDLPEVFLNLFDDAAATNDFSLTLPWFALLAETTLQRYQRLRIYGVKHEARPCLILPMYEETNGKLMKSRRLTSLANCYTSLTGPVAGQASTGMGNILASVIGAMIGEKPRWDTIDLHPLAVDDDVFHDLSNALLAGGMLVQRYFCFGNWYLDVGGRSYNAYFEGLPSKLRHTLVRQSRKLTLAKRLRVNILSTGENLDQGISDYQQIYNSSWKTPEPFPSFIPGLIRLCARQGWLRLGIAYIDDEPAAAQIWIIHNRVASIFKLAYDERFSHLSAGSILTASMMQHVIDVDQVDEVDYLTGDDSYKRDWMSHRRERWGIVAFNPRTLSGALSAFRHLGARRIRNLFGRIAGRVALLRENMEKILMGTISPNKQPNT
ncbi:MAG: family N-acetyltransferase [Herbaspirillum sp.]|nr:family N-acetyltransferase [Herbaspirillum sp.]